MYYRPVFKPLYIIHKNNLRNYKVPMGEGTIPKSGEKKHF